MGVVAMVLLGTVLAGLVSGCGGSSPQVRRPDPSRMVDSGSWYVKERWPHDGNPLESENFVVYSDGASLAARERLASLAEEVLAEVVDEMGVDPPTMFRYPADQDKIHLYANRYHILEGGGARAYYAGVIIWSFDYEGGRENTDVAVVRLTLKHELVHVVEALLKGRFVGDVAVGDPRRMPVWFSEGAAEALSGGSTGGSPRTLDEVDALIAEFGKINPIAWRVDLPLSESVLHSYPNYYYPMAQLAVEYLLDADGLGRSPEDLAAVMLDMGEGDSFASAFEAHFGISESDYEAQFFARMDSYLPQSMFPVAPIGLGLVALIAASLMGGSLVWSYRRWPTGDTVPGTVDGPAWSPCARRSFSIEISVIAAISVAFSALLLFQVAFADLPPHTRRAPGYVAAAAYLIASAAILMWAVRRRAQRSRGAYLIPLLVIVATGITIVVVEQLF